MLFRHWVVVIKHVANRFCAYFFTKGDCGLIFHLVKSDEALQVTTMHQKKKQKLSDFRVKTPLSSNWQGSFTKYLSMLNNQQEGCEYHFFKVFGPTRMRIELECIVFADALPAKPIKFHCYLQHCQLLD